MRWITTLRRTLSAFRPDRQEANNRRAQYAGPEYLQGVPTDLGLDRIDRVCRDHLGSPLRSIAYAHLSAWKASGAYRLRLTLEDGRETHLILKEAVYDTETIPALEGLPVRPGPPEWEVFSSRRPALAELTARVYLAEEITQQKHYRYLLEDLKNDYHVVRPGDWMVDWVRHLPAVHRELETWRSAEQPAGLIDFTPEAKVEVLAYAQNNLITYARHHSSSNLQKTLTLFPSIRDRLARDSWSVSPPRSALHGDLNYTNLFLHNTDPAGFKLLDWEWAGVDLPHADLVSLLKGSPAPLEARAFQNYVAAVPELTPDQHRRFYNCCKIERGLLDAGFLASQALHTRNETLFNLHSAVSSSLNRVLSTYQEMQ